MISLWLILLLILGSIGLALLFVGMLMVLLAALGNRHYVFGGLFFALFVVPMVLARSNHKIGFAMILLIPITLVYCYRHQESASYAKKLLLPGLAVSVLTGVLGWVLFTYFGVTTINHR